VLFLSSDLRKVTLDLGVGIERAPPKCWFS
jgi:hypothetical protein